MSAIDKKDKIAILAMLIIFRILYKYSSDEKIVEALKNLETVVKEP